MLLSTGYVDGIIYRYNNYDEWQKYADIMGIA